MLRNGERFCDVCEVLIPEGERYCVTAMDPENAKAFLDSDVRDPELLPSWTQEEDGTVRMDICMRCHAAMR